MGVDRERRRRPAKAIERYGLGALICCPASDVLLFSGYWPLLGKSVATLTSEDGSVLVMPEDEQKPAPQDTQDPRIAFGFAAAEAAGRSRIHPRPSGLLQQGSTFNLELSAYVERYGGIRHRDTAAVTGEDAWVITHFGERRA